MKPNNLTVGERVRKFRLQRGMSQLQLCKGICSNAAISSLENNKMNATPGLLFKLAERLEVPSEYLLDGMQNSEFTIDVIRLHIEARDYENVKNLIEELDEGQLLPDQKLFVRIAQAECKLFTGEVDVAATDLQDLEEHFKIGVVPPNVEVTCWLWNTIGNAYYLQQNWVKAYAFYMRAFKLIHDLPAHHFLYTYVTYNLGNACRANGFYQESMTYLELAQRQLDNRNLRAHAQICYAAALSQKNLGNLDVARSMLNEATGILRAQNYKELELKIRLHYAVDFAASSDHVVEVEEIRIIAHEFEQIGDHSLALLAYTKIAELSMRSDDLGTARESLDLASVQLDLIKRADQYVGYYHRICGILHYRFGDSEAAYQSLQKSIDIFKGAGLHRQAAESMEVLADQYTERGVLDQAIGLMKQAATLLKSKPEEVLA